MNTENQMMNVMIAAVDRIFGADNLELRRRRLRMSPQERFDTLPPELKAHNVCAYIESKKDPDGWVHDQIVSIPAKDILANFRAGDHAANGELIKRALYELGYRDDFWSDGDEE